ncbi:MAG TPA: acyltransferase [Caulobacteraceae bacterium]|nr:acyltransferase [Caulobacteraceae bacterium]
MAAGRITDWRAVREKLRAPQEIRSLNSIRGLAALMVATFHAPLLFGAAETLPHAYMAVDLFFVLSGFVMLHVYEPRITGGLRLGRFFQLRMARLYPLLAIATLLGFAVAMIKLKMLHQAPTQPMLAALPLSLVLAPAASAASEQHAAYPYVTQSWSIVWEILLCPMLFVWARWVRRGAWAIAAAGAIVLAWIAYTRGGIDGGWSTPTFWIGALRALTAFWAGVAVRQWTRFSVPRLVKLAGLAAAAAVLAYVCLVHPTIWWAEYASAVIGFPLIIAAACDVRARWLENVVGDRIGEASYSVYMLHNVTIEVIHSALKRVMHTEAVGSLALGLAWLAAIVCVSWLSWRFVESPLRRLFSRPLAWRPPVARPATLSRA